MSIDRLRYEILLMGKKVILTPVLVMLGFALFAALLSYLRVFPNRFLSGGLEMMLPITAGVVVATVAVHDPTLELLLTLPRRYAGLAMWRVVLIVGWTACVALLSSALLVALKLGYNPQQPDQSPALQFLVGQLTWLAPLLWCVAVALCFAVILRSPTASGALLGGIWIAETFFKDIFLAVPWLHPVLLFPTTLAGLHGSLSASVFTTWLTTRFELIGTALVLLLLGAVLLRRPEWLLKSSSEE
jgi:hypothetical protein